MLKVWMIGLLMVVAAGMASAQGIRVFVDGDEIDFGTGGRPMIKYKRVLVPMRGVLQKLGASVEFTPEEMKATAIKKGKKIELWVGSRHAMVNDEEVLFDTALAIENGRVMVPLRFLSEHLDGAKVHWDAKRRTVRINTR